MSMRDIIAKRRAERSNGAVPKKHGLAALREAKQAEKTKQVKSKLDFSLGGVRFHGAVVHSKEGRPWGTVLMSNGDKTFEFHNRHGSWMCNIGAEGGRMAEPAAVARVLGTGMGQLEVSQALMSRFNAEVKQYRKTDNNDD